MKFTGQRVFLAIVEGEGFTESFYCLVPVWDVKTPLTDNNYDAIRAVVAEEFCRPHWGDLEEVPDYAEMETPQKAFDTYFNENLEGNRCVLSHLNPGKFSRETLELMLQDVT